MKERDGSPPLVHITHLFFDACVAVVGVDKTRNIIDEMKRMEDEFKEYDERDM